MVSKRNTFVASDIVCLLNGIVDYFCDYQYDMGRNWFEVKQYAGIIFVFSIKISWPI